MLADKREKEKVDALKQYHLAMIDQNKAALAEKTRSDQALADYRDQEAANQRLHYTEQSQQFNVQEARRSKNQEDANKLAREKLEAQQKETSAKEEALAEQRKTSNAIAQGNLDQRKRTNDLAEQKAKSGSGGKADPVAVQRARGILAEFGGDQGKLDAEVKKARDDLGKLNTPPSGMSTKDQAMWELDPTRAAQGNRLQQRIRDLELARGWKGDQNSLDAGPPPTQPSQQGATPPGATGPGGGGGAQDQREMSDEEQQAALAPFRGMPQTALAPSRGVTSDQMGPEVPPDLQSMPPNAPLTPPVGSEEHDAMVGQSLSRDFAIAKNPMHPNYAYAWMRLAAKVPGIGRPPRRIMDSASQQMAMQASGLGASVLPIGPLQGPAMMAGTRMMQPAISDWFRAMLPDPALNDDSGR